MVGFIARILPRNQTFVSSVQNLGTTFLSIPSILRILGVLSILWRQILIGSHFWFLSPSFFVQLLRFTLIYRPLISSTVFGTFGDDAEHWAGKNVSSCGMWLSGRRGHNHLIWWCCLVVTVLFFAAITPVTPSANSIKSLFLFSLRSPTWPTQIVVIIWRGGLFKISCLQFLLFTI